MVSVTNSPTWGRPREDYKQQTTTTTPFTARLGLSLSSFFVRALAPEGHTKNEIVQESLWKWPKGKWGKAVLSMEAQAMPLCVKSGVDPFRVAALDRVPWPPDWLLDPRIGMDLDLPASKEENPTLLRNLFLETMARRYPYHRCIYTDGSLIGEGEIGAGVYVPD